MALAACAEMLFTSLQSIFSTSVGVSFAYPILSQVIDIKNEKTLKECDRVMRITEKMHGKAGLAHLGREKNQYQFKLHVLAKLNAYLTALSAIIGVLAFFLLVVSSLYTSICISQSSAMIVCVSLSAPFALGVYQLLRWHDAYTQFQGAIEYYRGDRNWRGKRI